MSHMRKIILIILNISFIVSFASAQRQANLTWFDISVKGAYGSTFLINRNILNDNNAQMNIMKSNNYSYGLRLGFFVNEFTGISFEGQNMIYTQVFDLKNGGRDQNINYAKTIAFEAQDLALLFRVVLYTGVYAEIGPKMSWMQLVETTNSIDAEFQDVPSDQYKERYTSVVGGLGIAVLRTPDDRLRLNLGVRLHYSIDNIMKDANWPPLEDGVYNMNYEYASQYSDIQTTKPLFVQAVAEINYFFGFYGRARCGRTKFVLFRSAR